MMLSGPRATFASLCQRNPLVLVGFGVVLYSLGPVLIGGSETTGPTLSFWRLWFGASALGLAALVAMPSGGASWPSPRTPVGARAWKLTIAAGVAFGLHQLAFFSAVKATSVTDVLLTTTLTPIVVTIAAVPMFGERPGARFRVWTLMAIAGAAVVVLGASTGPEGNPGGMAIALFAVLFYSAFFMLSKRGREVIDVLPFLTVSLAVAATTVTIYCVATGEVLTDLSQRDLLFALLIAVGPGGLGHFVMIWPLRWVAANIPPVMRLAQPIIGGIVAWAWLGQPITTAHLIGGAITIAGVLGALSAHRGGRSPQPTGAPTGAR